MPASMAEPRKIKIFVASPSDVQEERETLARLVAEINDTLAYLVPEKELSLELVRYETHAYPDLGRPQDVIDREIPIDYDILVGVMWRRAGTPTAKYPSGTIHEFHRALDKRKTSSLPRIMFYFCEQAIPMPTTADMEQLQEVVKFKTELQSQGLTSPYPSHAEFGEHVRGGLLRAIRDILREQGVTAAAEVPVAPAQVDKSAEQEAERLAEEYQQIRRDMLPSPDRTRRMAAVFGRMKTLAPKVRGLLRSYEQSDSPGSRLLAVAILNMFPSADHLDWLAERLDPSVEKPFVGYNAAVGFVEAVNALPADACGGLRISLDKAMELAKRRGDDPDRIKVLERADKELKRKCGGQ